MSNQQPQYHTPEYCDQIKREFFALLQRLAQAESQMTQMYAQVRSELANMTALIQRNSEELNRQRELNRQLTAFLVRAQQFLPFNLQREAYELVEASRRASYFGGDMTSAVSNTTTTMPVSPTPIVQFPPSPSPQGVTSYFPFSNTVTSPSGSSGLASNVSSTASAQLTFSPKYP